MENTNSYVNPDQPKSPRSFRPFVLVLVVIIILLITGIILVTKSQTVSKPITQTKNQQFLKDNNIGGENKYLGQERIAGIYLSHDDTHIYVDTVNGKMNFVVGAGTSFTNAISTSKTVDIHSQNFTLSSPKKFQDFIGQTSPETFVQVVFSKSPRGNIATTVYSYAEVKVN